MLDNFFPANLAVICKTKNNLMTQINKKIADNAHIMMHYQYLTHANLSKTKDNQLNHAMREAVRSNLS